MTHFSLRLGLATLLMFNGAISSATAEGAASTVAPAVAQTVAQAAAQTVAQTAAQSGSSITAQLLASASVIYVNPVLGQDSGNGDNSAAPLRTITYALQQADSNTVIQLAAGSYTRDTGEVFPLVLRSGVSLRGDAPNKGQTVLIIGSGEYISPTFARQNVTIRALEDSELIGVTVTNPNTRGTAVWVESTDPTIRDNTFSNSLRDGVFVTGTGTPRIEGNVFTRNSGNGIAAVRESRGEIRNNVFQNTGFGIAVGDNAAPTIANSQILNNVDGIVVSNSARPTLRNNTIENNTRDGVVAIANALPNLGTAEDSGSNVIRNNGRYNLYNATRSNTLFSIGNEIDPSRISGLVEFVASNTPASTFTDVRGHWAQAYIDALATRGVINGFPDGTFRPDAPVTRAQFAAIINKAFTPNPKRSEINFVDVRSDFWGRQAIQSAYQGQFMSGYPGQTFQPEQRIPRVQVVASLASGLELSTDRTTTIDRYQDVSQIPSWAVGAIAAATQQNIIVNYPITSQLNPNREATRAEVAAFIYQALVRTGQADPIPSPYVVSP
jgi:parallel beta-helix repeat protein